MTLRRRAVVVLCLLVGCFAIPRPAGADSVEEKRREAARIADQIEHLENEALTLGEDYEAVSERLERVSAEVESAKIRVAKLEDELGDLRGSLAGVALNQYVYGGDDSALTALLTGEAGVVALERSHYAELLLQGGNDQADKLETVTEDATREREVLESKMGEQRDLQDSLAARQKRVEAAIAEKNELQEQVAGELAELVAQEQARRAEAARRAATSSSGGGNRTSRAPGGGGEDDGGSGDAPREFAAPEEPSGPGPGANVPPPSSGASGAIAAAMSQLGVGYRYASASPGVAFDCSGLTRWAWGQAGVSLPNNSRAQAAATPDVPQSAIQPGDLIFYYSPISHVGIYIGGGQLVHATRPGDVVKVAAVNWGKVVTIGRPG